MENLAVEYLLGPWLIGTSVDLLFQGILSTQFVKYFGVFRSDPIALKVFVGFVAVLTYLRSIQAFAMVWFQLITHFGNMTSSINVYWWLSSGMVLAAAICLSVQGYFCSRLFLISKNMVVAPICAVFIFAYAATVVAFRYMFLGPHYTQNIERWFSIYLPAVMAGDILLSSATVYFLMRSKKHAIPQNIGLFNALIRLTFQTAAPATICAVTNFVLNLCFPDIFPGARTNASAGINTTLPKLYVFSMMWTLSARSDIRATLLPSVIDARSVSGADFCFTSREGNAEHCSGEHISRTSTTLSFKASQGSAGAEDTPVSIAGSGAATMTEGSLVGNRSE